MVRRDNVSRCGSHAERNFFFVRAEQVLIHNIFSLFKSMWLLGQISKSQVDP